MCAGVYISVHFVNKSACMHVTRIICITRAAVTLVKYKDQRKIKIKFHI
jgi:hypothetical protein